MSHNQLTMSTGRGGLPDRSQGLLTRALLFSSVYYPRFLKVRRFLVRHRRSKILIMPGNLPIEQNVFHPWPLADVVNNHVPTGLRRFLVHYHSNVRDVSSQIPRNEIARKIIPGVFRER